MTTQTSAFTVAYAPERAQYCVERADGMRVYPMPMPFSDPDAGKRAAKLAEVLNRLEGAPSVPEPTPDIPPDYCYKCDEAVYGVRVPVPETVCTRPRAQFACNYPACSCAMSYMPADVLRCPECGAQVAEGTSI